MQRARTGIAALISLLLLACAEYLAGSAESCGAGQPCEGGLVCLQGACKQLCTEHHECNNGETCCHNVCSTQCRPCPQNEMFCPLTCCEQSEASLHQECDELIDAGVDVCAFGGECVCPATGEPCPPDQICTDDGCAPRCDDYPDGTECGARFCAGLTWSATVCEGGACNATDAVQTCDDGEICTDDLCDPETGCHHTPAAPGTPCGAGVCDGAGTCVECTGAAQCPEDGWVEDPPHACSGAQPRRRWQTWSCVANVCQAVVETRNYGSKCVNADCCVDGVCRSIHKSYRSSSVTNCESGYVNCSCQGGCSTEGSSYSACQ